MIFDKKWLYHQGRVKDTDHSAESGCSAYYRRNVADYRMRGKSISADMAGVR